MVPTRELLLGTAAVSLSLRQDAPKNWEQMRKAQVIIFSRVFVCAFLARKTKNKRQRPNFYLKKIPNKSKNSHNCFLGIYIFALVMHSYFSLFCTTAVNRDSWNFSVVVLFVIVCSTGAIKKSSGRASAVWKMKWVNHDSRRRDACVLRSHWTIPEGWDIARSRDGPHFAFRTIGRATEIFTLMLWSSFNVAPCNDQVPQKFCAAIFLIIWTTQKDVFIL